ncbi:MAG: multisubunit sodium/proton antiporter, MrpF subunit [Rickettsiaceae bacterium]|nr:multisubunit sodium/proton antiporter, MrpF subunit [Rickettsiaceae bacterium]
MILEAAVFGLLMAMAMTIIRGIVGSTAFDRILAANMFATIFIALIVLVGHMRDTEFFIDIAITYGLVNFVTTFALLRYFKYDPSEK